MEVGRAGGKSTDVLTWSTKCLSSFLMFALPKTVVKGSGFNVTWNKAWNSKDWDDRDCRDEKSIDFLKTGSFFLLRLEFFAVTST